MLNVNLWSVVRDSLYFRAERKSECFLFESARTALFHALSAMNVGRGAEVIVSAFTCDAVTYAVMQTGAVVVYVDINDDLTMNASAVMAAITGKTKAVVVQNTLGRVGLDTASIEHIKARGILVVEDCALSIGSRLDDVPHGRVGDISTWSLEASKMLTIGWGGVLTVNDSNRLEIFRRHYLGLKCVPIWLDLLRVFQLWLSVLLTAHPPPCGIYLWYFLYGFRLFRRSSDSQQKYYITHARLGAFSSSLFHSINERLEDIFRQANENYMILGEKAKELGLRCPVVPDEREFIVSPRFSLIVGEGEREFLTQAAASAGVELGRWFDQAPPSYRLDLARVSSSANARRISGVIINLPCHWSLSPKDLQPILGWMETIVSVRSLTGKQSSNE